MIKICALASGSNGNCYYIGDENSAILIDLGISHRQLKKRLADANLSMKNIKAVFISHEHADHVKGLRVTLDNNNIDSYITKKTYNRIRPDFRPYKTEFFLPEDTISIGNIRIHSFSKQHDAIEPVSFRVEIDNINIGVITDLGTIDKNVKKHMDLCNAIFLESNYDDDLLKNGKYPEHLKKRVASNHGHLSNNQAIELVKSISNNKLKTILLSHISEDNNNINIITEEFKSLYSNYQIEMTSRFGISNVIDINE
jgi:phosphoribosyl 1,2-cyclic phosphodiesterase